MTRKEVQYDCENFPESVDYWRDRILKKLRYDTNHSKRDSNKIEKHVPDYTSMMDNFGGIELFINLTFTNMLTDAYKLQHDEKLIRENISQTHQRGSDHYIDLDKIYSFFKGFLEKMKGEGKQDNFYRRIDQTNGEYPKPTVTVSDIHGSSTTLLMLLKIMHDLEKEVNRKPDRLMFNLIITGDVVDRGRRSINDLLVVLLFYLVFPEDVIYVRGNHEDLNINKRYGPEWSEAFRDNKKALILLDEIYHQLPVLAVVYDIQLYFHGGLNRKSTINFIKYGEQPDKNDIKNVTWLDVHLDEIVHHNARGIEAIDNNLRDFYHIQDAFDNNNRYMVVTHGHKFTNEGVKTNIVDRHDGKKIVFNLVASSIERGPRGIAGININCGRLIINLKYSWSAQRKCFQFNIEGTQIPAGNIPYKTDHQIPEIDLQQYYFVLRKISKNNGLSNNKGAYGSESTQYPLSHSEITTNLV